MKRQFGILISIVFILIFVIIPIQVFSSTKGDIIQFSVEDSTKSTLKLPKGSSSIINGGKRRIRKSQINTYTDKYGEQLVGLSEELFNAIVKNYADDKNIGNYEYTLQTPITFQATVSNGAIVEDNEYLSVKNQIKIALQNAGDAFSYDYPEVFWVEKWFISYNISYNSDSKVAVIEKILFKPSEILPGISNKQAQYNASVQSAITSINSKILGNNSRYKTVKAIHDYICENMQYNLNGDATIYSSSGAFLGNKDLVCEGYAKTFKVLCDRYNIPCALAAGVAIISNGNNKNHMWNLVQMEDNNWYLVDTTWDDQASGIRTTYILAGSLSEGFYYKICDERTANGDFSGSGYFTFILPELSEEMYDPNGSHNGQHNTEISKTVPQIGFSAFPRWTNGNNEFEIFFKKDVDDDHSIGKGFITICERGTDRVLLKIDAYKDGEDWSLSSGYYYKGNNALGVLIKPQDALPIDTDIYVTLTKDVINYSDGTSNESLVDKRALCYHTYSLDTLKETNSTLSEEISKDKYYDFYKPLTASILRLIDNGKNGICFGICYATSAWKERYSVIRQTNTSNCLNECDVYKKTFKGLSVLDYMQYAQLYQYSSNAQKTRSYDLQIIYDRLKKYFSGKGSPVIITAKGSGGGHAFFPVSFEENSNQFKVLLYNCNAPQSLYYLKISKENNSCTNWEINNSYNKELSTFLINNGCDSAISEIGKGKVIEDNNLLITTNSGYTINGNDEPFFSNSEDYLPISYVSTSINKDNSDCYWVNNKPLILNSKNKPFKTSIFSDGYKAIELSSDKAASVTFNGAGDILIDSGNEANINAKSSFINSKNIESERIIDFSCTAADKARIKRIDNETIIISGITSLKVNTEKNQICEIEKLNPEMFYKIEHQEKEVTVFEDSKENGKYKTFIASSQTIKNLKFKENKYNILKGETIDLKEELITDPSTIITSRLVWENSNSNVASLDTYGFLTAKDVGTTVVRVMDISNNETQCVVEIDVQTSETNNDNHNPSDTDQSSETPSSEDQSSVPPTQQTDNTGDQSTQIPTVDNSNTMITSIEIAGLSKKIAAGKKLKLTADILPENATNKTIIWSSSNKKIATVTQSGLVKIKKKKTKGKTVKIIATAADGSGVKAVWKIKVMKGVVKIVRIKKAKSSLKAGKTMKLKAAVKATKGANKKLKWISSNPKYATVSSKGIVKALNAGKGNTVKITAMATDGSGKKKTIKIKIK